MSGEPMKTSAEQELDSAWGRGFASIFTDNVHKLTIPPVLHIVSYTSPAPRLPIPFHRGKLE